MPWPYRTRPVPIRLDGLNERFQVAATNPADLHRRVPRPARLEYVLSYQETRVVQNDWTIS